MESLAKTTFNDSATTPKMIALPKILLATDNPQDAAGVVDYLKAYNYDVIITLYDGEKLRGTPKQCPCAILCYFTDFVERSPDIAVALKNYYTPYVLPVIAALARYTEFQPGIFDSIIFPPAHHSQIANRMNSMIRLQSMEREIIHRVETLSDDFGIQHNLSDDLLSQPFRIMFIGNARPEFMIIINALQKRNVEVVAAFTSYSAFDFLHERTFDAVVMNAIESSEPAMTISETMRRNSKLFHVPTLFLIDEDSFTDHDMAYKKGARDIISSKAPLDEISGRVLELANYHRIHNQLKREFSAIGGPKCVRASSGVFNAEFFSKHLNRICIYNQNINKPVSLVGLRVRPQASFELADYRIEQAIKQVGKILKNLVRMQDTVAQIGDDIFSIAFIDVTQDGLTPILDRISGIVDCTAFESGNKDAGAFTMTMEIVTFDMMDHETGDMMIGNVIAELGGEPNTVELLA